MGPIIKEVSQRKFDKEFFDGERSTGYGGFDYNEKYWKDVVIDFRDYWKLNDNSSILGKSDNF